MDIVSETLDNGGRVIIPSFAVGRTQEILYELNKIKENTEDENFIRKYNVLMETPVYVDSPLAISATEIFKKNEDLFDYDVKQEIERGDNPLEFPGLEFTRSAEESKSLNEDDTPKIIISASGMCDVGRIKHHLKHNIWNSRNTILFVGYQAPGTLGRKIIDGAKKIKIFGEEIAVNAKIEYIEGYSGHADQEWLLNFIYSFMKKPSQIILVHGETDSQEVLKEKIEQTTDIPVTIPSLGEIYNLDDSKIELVGKLEIQTEYETKKDEVLSRIRKLKEEIEDMEEILKEEKLKDNKDETKAEYVNKRLMEIEQLIVKIIE